jgi:histidinol-phosphatase
MTPAMTNRSDIEAALDTARAAVEAAGRIALEHFERGVTAQHKADRSIVTEADVAAEKAILALLEARDPDATVLAEESGIHDRASARRWIVDPIDGTRGFARGGELWGPLVALEAQGEIVAGAMAMPVRGRTYWAAKDLGAWRDGHRLRVSAVDAWSEATLSLGETTRLLAAPYGEAVTALATTAASTRCFGDLAGAALVLDGLAEVWIECGVKPWDLAPSKILIEEAGGRWTTFGGGADLTEGTAIGSNGRLHDRALGLLRAV